MHSADPSVFQRALKLQEQLFTSPFESVYGCLIHHRKNPDPYQPGKLDPWPQPRSHGGRTGASWRMVAIKLVESVYSVCECFHFSAYFFAYDEIRKCTHSHFLQHC